MDIASILAEVWAPENPPDTVDSGTFLPGAASPIATLIA
jgi:hypothetical protein